MNKIIIQKPKVISSRLYRYLVFQEWINLVIEDIFEITNIEDEEEKDFKENNKF